MSEKFTKLEISALKDLWASSQGNGHDFGFTNELPSIPKASRGGVIASLIEKGVIFIHETLRVNKQGEQISQFGFTFEGTELFEDFDNSSELKGDTKVIKKVEKKAAKKVEKKVETEVVLKLNPKRIAVLKALKELKATSASNARTREEVVKHSKQSDQTVKHVLYKDEPLVSLGYVTIHKEHETDEGKVFAYYLTKKGKSIKLPE